MKIYLHSPERPEASQWAEVPEIPAVGDMIMFGGFRFVVESRLWEFGDDKPEVTVYCELR